jgi:enterobacteria phage integrase
MGRPRKPANKTLPEHLYSERKGATTYYRYLHPHTKQMIRLGTDRAAALRAARLANSRLLSALSAEHLVARILTPSRSFADYAQHYLEDVLPGREDEKGRKLATKTLSEYRRYVQRAIEAWGPREVASVTRRDVAEHLSPMSTNVAKHARSTLMGLFAHAIADGHVEVNPVTGTLAPKPRVQRERLEPEQYPLVHAKAEPWLQHAMDVALACLQRREDLVKLDARDLVDGALHVRQGKTGMNLRIRLWPELGMLMPREGPVIRNAKGKAITPEYFSRAFQAARDKVPELSAKPSARRPSLHELRSLGARILQDEGIDPQTLLGHTEAKTTRLYLDRYKETWVEV